VIIVDTSASVARPIATPPDSLVRDVEVAIVQTAHPTDAIDGAVAWLSMRTGWREIVLMSDFQRSSTDTAFLRVADGIGLSVIPSEARDLLLSEEQAPRFARDDIQVVAGPTDLAGATAAWRAVGLPLPSDADARIAIIYKDAPSADSLSRAAVPIDSDWMGRLVAALDRDSTLVAAGLAASHQAKPRTDLDVVGAPSRNPAIVAGRNGDRLSLFVLADAGSLPSAALNAALLRLTSRRVPPSELDTATWSAADLAPFARKAEPTKSTSNDASDARWFWLACVAMLGLETWMRSRTPKPTEGAGLAQAQERAA
jgi:hypothetical protein